MLGFDEIVNINISEMMIMLVKLYEKVRQKYYRNPVDRLREKGAVIGDNVHIYDGGGASIDYNFCFLLTIGNNVTISNSTLLMHDASIKKELGYVKIGKITIGDNVFVGAGCIILPNVKIGNKVIIGAGSVVSKNIPDGVVAVGNPVRIIGTYDEYMEKCSNWISTRPCFDEASLDDEKQLIRQELDNWGFIK